jgi:beta-lactam-binding protein with PASTA domain/tRNA A-37 threonylcarbamoyl transferase component Bud32
VSDTNTAPAPRIVGDRYRLLDELGRGGMATVHRAHDRVLDRHVAIKLLHADLADDSAFLDRFRREARAAAGIAHANVVMVYDWGETDDGTFMVLELIEGLTLRDVLRLRGRVSPGEALSLLGPAAVGLAAAHGKGLVHRDVKPENLLLADQGVVKVTDFGLARAAASSTRTFGAEVLVGSPHYLSPEAVEGDVLDARSDVYSLGIVLFECLTGQPPYEGDSPLATAVQHTRRMVPAPSSLVPGLPAAVDRVVLTATAPDPDDRYDDAAAFAVALARAVPEGPATVDLRDGTHDTVVIPGHAAETIVGITGEHDTTAIRQHADDARPAPRRRGLRTLLALLLLVAVAAGGWTVYDQVVAPVTPVPLVVDDPTEAARAALEEAGFEVEVAPNARFDLGTPAGHVLEQSLTGQARKGTVVTLVASAGPKQVELPAVAGRDEDVALADLEGPPANLVATVERVYSDEVPAGQVIATEPAGGQMVSEGSEVRVLVSQGRAPVEVPSVVGQEQAAAVAALEEAGLVVGFGEEEHDDDVPAGVVLRQAPAAQETVLRGDTVTLVVSKGPAPVEVPEVRGLQEDEATRLLSERGLEVEVIYVDTVIPFRAGKVDDQDPEPGTERRRGDTVRLFVWR